jgi:biopolymer transport protein ExbD
MAFSMAGGGPSRPEINVAPLIDVLLVLIITFMVIVAQEPKDKGLDAQIPQPQPGNDKTPEVQRTIVIEVVSGPQGELPTLMINQQDQRWDELGARLRDIFKTRAERIAFVRGDSDVEFQYVADAIDIARDAGAQRVGLLTAQQEAVASAPHRASGR